MGYQVSGTSDHPRCDLDHIYHHTVCVCSCHHVLMSTHGHCHQLVPLDIGCHSPCHQLSCHLIGDSGAFGYVISAQLPQLCHPLHFVFWGHLSLCDGYEAMPQGESDWLISQRFASVTSFPAISWLCVHPIAQRESVFSGILMPSTHIVMCAVTPH